MKRKEKRKMKNVKIIYFTILLGSSPREYNYPTAIGTGRCC